MVQLYPELVDRFVVAMSGTVILDDDGMLDVTGTRSAPSNGLLPISELRNRKSLCLLGEPGAGKTTALKTLTTGLPTLDLARRDEPAVLSVALAEVSNRQDFHELVLRPIFSRVVQSGDTAAATRTKTLLTLVLDGIDECPLQNAPKTLASLLRDLFAQINRGDLRVLLGCRTAEFPAAIHEAMSDVDSAFSVFELAPLTRDDVGVLSASRGVDSDTFLDSVKETGTGPLASIPLTLDLLLRRFQATGALVGGATMLYEDALRTLANEPDSDRNSSNRGVGSGDQRFTVAARLCCYLQLCGAGAFWVGEHWNLSEGDIDPFVLAGGHERQTGGDFEVTTQLIDAAVKSALFSSRGPSRLGPVHASFAAYLTARHLIACDVPESQLRDLLTKTNENGNIGVPLRLREVAAWLVALRPEANFWLIQYDLVGMATYAVLITDSDVRREIVARLLSDPHPNLYRRTYRSWRLNHPRLANQLSEVLIPFADRSLPAPTTEQTQLAILLARDCVVVDLVPTLLEVAARTDADHWLRSMAVSTAAHLDRASSNEPLRTILDELVGQPLGDPQDEIRGAVLESLWPGSLSVAELVIYLTPAKVSNFYGLYESFRAKIPERASDDDLGNLLHWAVTVTTASVTDANSRSFNDEELVDRLLERAFDCLDTGPVILPAADLVAAQLRAYRDLYIPGPMDRRTDDGTESPESRILRRNFTLLLLKRLGEHHVNRIVWGWHSSPSTSAHLEDSSAQIRQGFPPPRIALVDKDDFAWLLDEALALANSSDDVSAIILLLRFLFDPTDAGCVEAAYATSGTPLWLAFSSWFDAVPLGGDEEAVARQALEASVLSQSRPVWEHVAVHTERVLELYSRAKSETQAYWKLMFDLLTIPNTGQTFRQWSDDISSRPGVVLLPEGWTEYLVDASFNYLETSAPTDDKYLSEPNMIHWPIEAGYLAFAHLSRFGRPGRDLDSLSDLAWQNWTGAIVIFPVVPSNAGNKNIKRDLLARLVGPERNALPRSVDVYIGGQLEYDLRLSELELLDVAYTVDLGEVLYRRLEDLVMRLVKLLRISNDLFASEAQLTNIADGARQEIVNREAIVSTLVDNLETLIKLLLRNQNPFGIDMSLQLISSAASAESEDDGARIGRAAARAILTQSPQLWPEVLDIIRPSPNLTRLILIDMSRDWVAPAILANLSEIQLADFWELMKHHWPYEEDRQIAGAHLVGPDEQAQQMRDQTISILVQRGTAESLTQLTRLARNNPALPWLSDWLRTAEEREREMCWAPLLPSELTSLLSDRRNRFVRSSSELSDLVVEKINVVSEQLVRIGQLLWDHNSLSGEDLWRPKSESDFGAWLSEALRVELSESGIVVNREVLVRQTTERGGLAVDVQADASVTIDDAGRRAAPARCRIELKGCWNRELMTAMRTQLFDDYLLIEGLTDGVYVIAWFDIDQWNDSRDTRLSIARSRSRDEVQLALNIQATEIGKLGVRIQTVIVDIPRPTRSLRAS